MTIADRDRLTAMVLAAMKAGMKNHGEYPGGPAKLLADMLTAWGVPADPRNLKNRTCGKFRAAAESSFSAANTRKL